MPHVLGARPADRVVPGHVLAVTPLTAWTPHRADAQSHVAVPERAVTEVPVEEPAHIGRVRVAALLRLEVDGMVLVDRLAIEDRLRGRGRVVGGDALPGGGVVPVPALAHVEVERRIIVREEGRGPARLRRAAARVIGDEVRASVAAPEPRRHRLPDGELRAAVGRSIAAEDPDDRGIAVAPPQVLAEGGGILRSEDLGADAPLLLD